MTRATPHGQPTAPLLDDVFRDVGDRVPLNIGCALLGVPERTFRRQYLSNDRGRAIAKARFALEGETRRDQTVSRRLIEAHRAEIAGGSWGGPYCPPGAWSRRLREATASEATAAGAGASDALKPALSVDGDAETCPASRSPAHPQRDLFEP